MLRKMLGLRDVVETPSEAPLARPLAANGPRTHYMRAHLENGQLSAADSQDSSLLRVLSTANALLIRPPHDPPRDIGERLPYLPI